MAETQLELNENTNDDVHKTNDIKQNDSFQYVPPNTTRTNTLHNEIISRTSDNQKSSVRNEKKRIDEVEEECKKN